MIKLMEVKGALPQERGKTATLVREFIDSGMRQAKLDTSDDQRPLGTIHGGLYGYLRQNPDLHVKIQMVNGELYLLRIDNDSDGELKG